MPNKQMSVNRQQALKITKLQLLVLIIVTSFILINQNFHAASSLFIGGMIAWLATIAFVHFSFQVKEEELVKQLLNQLYLGEGLKFIISFVLLSLFLQMKQFLPGYLLSGYIIILLCQWMAPIVFNNSKTKVN